MSMSIESMEFQAFLQACENGDLAKVHTALEQCDNNHRQELLSHYKFSCLRHASDGGHKDVIQLLIKACDTPNEMIEAYNYECFLGACGNGHADVVLLLLELYEEPRAMLESQDYKCLTVAKMCGRPEIVYLLYGIINSIKNN